MQVGFFKEKVPRKVVECTFDNLIIKIPVSKGLTLADINSLHWQNSTLLSAKFRGKIVVPLGQILDSLVYFSHIASDLVIWNVPPVMGAMLLNTILQLIIDYVLLQYVMENHKTLCSALFKQNFQFPFSDSIFQGAQCCSDYPISFHYVNQENMYALEYWLYHAKVHGYENSVPPWPQVRTLEKSK